MDFGKVLTRAREIIWKHKILWIFGILVSCGGRGGGPGGMGGQGGINYQLDSGDLRNLPRGMEQFFFEMERSFERVPEWTFLLVVVGLVALAVVVSLILFGLATFGRVALIQGTIQVEQGSEGLRFGQLARDSLPFLWRALGLNILIFILLFVTIIALVAVGMVFSVVTLGVGMLLLLPLMCLFIPAMWFVGVVIEQANVALVVEDTGIGEALRRGWGVVRENVGNMVVMGLILILGGGIVSFVIGLPLVLALAPLLMGVIGGAVSGSGGLLVGGLGIAGLCLVVYVPILIVLNGILMAYIETAWTLTYLEVRGQGEAGEAREMIPETSG